jgi:hypothetical protein
VLSGTVTSSTRIALSLQDGVGLGSDGFSVGEAVGGTSVGSVNPGFVGGSVDVTKRTGASVGVSRETLPQEVNSKRTNKTRGILLIILFSWGLAKFTV